MAAPWDIYERQMKKTLPSMTAIYHANFDKTAREIQLGDVGFLSQGRFRRIFNICHSAVRTDQAAGTQKSVLDDLLPKGHKPFKPPKGLHVCDLDALTAKDYSQHETSALAGGVGASFGLPSVRGGIKVAFSGTTDEWAHLEIASSAVHCFWQPEHRPLRNYMRINWHEWVSLAMEQWDISTDRLFLVNGTYKTDKWWIETYSHKSRLLAGKLGIDVESFGSASASAVKASDFHPSSVTLAGAHDQKIHCDRSLLLNDEDDYCATSLPTKSQCIFVDTMQPKRIRRHINHATAKFKYSLRRLKGSTSVHRQGANDIGNISPQKAVKKVVLEEPLKISCSKKPSIPAKAQKSMRQEASIISPPSSSSIMVSPSMMNKQEVSPSKSDITLVASDALSSSGSSEDSFVDAVEEPMLPSSEGYQKLDFLAGDQGTEMTSHVRRKHGRSPTPDGVHSSKRIKGNGHEDTSWTETNPWGQKKWHEFPQGALQ